MREQFEAGGLRKVMGIALAVIAVVAGGATALWLGRAGKARPPAVAPSTGPKGASELFAADGKTLIARFDADPQTRCLAARSNEWGYFCDYLVTWWQQQPAFGADAGQRLSRLRTGGYRIVGSLDVGLQAAAQRRVEAAVPAGSDKTFSLVTIAPGSGLVKAMAVNRPYERPMLPLAAGGAQYPGAPAGDTFMMFTVAAALEAGLTLDHTIDTKRVYESRYVIDKASPAACGPSHHWCPANTGDRAYQSGPRTMWDALGHAVTTYFVQLEEALGADKVVDMARRLGIQFRAAPDRQFAEKYAAQWGAFTLGVSQVSALDLANAYATLAADGKHCDPLPVQAITDAAGAAVTGAGPHCAAVLSADAAHATIDAGRCPVGDRPATGDLCGTGTVPAAGVRATVGRPVAGQFGTSHDGAQAALVLTSPGMSTAGIVDDAAGTGVRGKALPVKTVSGFIQAVAQVQHDGLASTAAKEFPAPPQSLVRGHS
jgi:membrane peptidoglycan carboxypeptidase